MLKKILNKIKTKFSLNEKKGIFLSLFNNEGKLIYSKGVVFTDKSINKLVDILYHAVPDDIRKKIKIVVVDVVKNIIQLNNMKEILGTDIKKYGLLIIASNSDQFGVILPDMEEIVDVRNALYLIKKKFGITEKKVIIYRFDTERFIIKV